MNLVPLSKQNVMENIDRLMEIDKTIFDEEGPWGIENFLIDLPLKWEYSFMVFINHEIVGFIVCSVKGNDLYVHRIAILGSYQNMGIGSKLLDLTSEICLKDNLQCVKLQVKKNNIVRKIYEKKGFVNIGSNGLNYIYRKGD